jgi:cytochrome c oxidase cbb3-type subunit 3
MQLRQIVVPALRVADRCVTCHVGMAAGEQGVVGDKVLAPHPRVGHDPAEYGCTTCHAGQGRATEAADAHGSVPHWPEPMIPKRYVYAGCGACHTHLAIPGAAELARAATLFERYDCLACHKLDGRGGTLRPGESLGMEGPDLSRAGATGYDRGWYAGHGKQREKGGAWRLFAPIPEADRATLDAFLSTRVGAPALVEAKALFNSLGCRGCHKVRGVGGDEGPDLTRIGERDPARLDFTHVPGERTVVNWLAHHFRAPAAIVPGSQMPALGLREADIDLLNYYVLSLRRSGAPDAYWPVDRIRTERFGEREFRTDGASLFGAFCAACHGAGGEGRRYAGASPFPAIGSPDFLGLAPDAFLRATIEQGRAGRRMPAWGEKGGGLRPAEIGEIVAHLRRLGGGTGPEPDPRPARWVGGDAQAGRRLYAVSCAGCHGKAGEGAEGPALSNPVLLTHATDTYLVETIRRGRRGTAMEGFATPSATRATLAASEIESVVAFIRTWGK